ncbi:MAG TPA: HAMP domain-containing sensor histidine kinase [Flavisolibacter sp.]|jgi:signal transduction histidine kinase|nr:HAMP domain-containing sensor histidine kinase [Flavisolibacter sp.]
MPVRVRITLIFSLLVFIILAIVCTGIYYFSFQTRINNIKSRLTNRAITTGRLLSQQEIFDKDLIKLIDSSTTLSYKNKTVQAYNYQNRRVYLFSDNPGDTVHMDPVILNNARANGSVYYSEQDREVVAYHYTDNNSRLVMVVAGEDVDGKENLKNLSEILTISFLVGNIFVLIVGYFFSRGLLQPVKNISKDVAEISAQNLTRRIEPGKSKDEWYQLSVTLNDLLNRLQESFDMQRRFISNASHELSTPLTAISSQLEVSMQRERSAEEYKKVLQSIHQDVQHLTKLTQTLLEFAKASGNPGGLEIDLVRIDEIILNLPAEVSKNNSSYIVKIEFENLPEEEESLLVFGNEPLLFTAINNIVINACKYSRDHTANVKLQVLENAIEIDVKDSGSGIENTEIEKIFQPFYRTDESRSEHGFGLGLSLASRIIKIHKGSIEVNSEINKGTTFQIRLPAAKSLEGLSKF